MKSSLFAAAGAAALLSIAITTTGCPKGASSPTIDPRALARATVETGESAWLGTAKACVSYAALNNDESTLKKCEEILDPARDALIAAAYAVDTWTDADQKNYPCLVYNVAKAISTTVDLLKSESVAVPPLVSDFLNLAAYYGDKCATSTTSSDAGAE